MRKKISNKSNLIKTVLSNEFYENGLKYDLKKLSYFGKVLRGNMIRKLNIEKRTQDDKADYHYL